MQLLLQLGSNLGQREVYLARARASCEQALGKISGQSSIYETAPWGVSDQDHYLNQVILIATQVEALECLRVCQRIEQELGRKRDRKWGARTIDIDLLFQDDQVIDHPELTLPHPFIQERRFVLQPLCELVADFQHPVLGRAVMDLLATCEDEGKVLRYLRS